MVDIDHARRAVQRAFSRHAVPLLDESWSSGAVARLPDSGADGSAHARPAV